MSEVATPKGCATQAEVWTRMLVPLVPPPSEWTLGRPQLEGLGFTVYLKPKTIRWDKNVGCGDPPCSPRTRAPQNWTLSRRTQSAARSDPAAPRWHGTRGRGSEEVCPLGRGGRLASGLAKAA
eukprot:165967-Chlamydomonas_euryale.AAC.6